MIERQAVGDPGATVMTDDCETLVDQEPASSYTSREIVRIHPRRVISWGIGPEAGMHGRDVDGAATVGDTA